MAFLEDLIQDARDAGADPSVRAVVFASTSPKYFSSGLDLVELLSLPDRSRLFERLVAAHRAVAAVPKPTVAAIGGTALLGGFVLALACDWRFAAAERGKVALSEIRLGLSPTLPLIRLVLSLTGRPGLVKSLVLRGETLRAEEAFQAGLVDEVLSGEGFMEAVLKEAERLAKMPAAAYASIKRDMREALLPGEDESWGRGLQRFQDLLATHDAKEGLQAMNDKRKPRWD